MPSCGHEVSYSLKSTASYQAKLGRDCRKCASVSRAYNRRKNDYSTYNEQIETLSREGMSNRKIALSLDITRDYVNMYLQSIDYSPAIERHGPPEPVDDLHSKCRKCEAVVKNDNFPYVISRKDGRRLAYCKSRRYRQCRESLLDNPESYWRQRQLKLARNKRGLEYNLPEGYLYNLWVLQKGICFYTDVPMEMTQVGNGLTHEVASVDRMDSSKGYLVGNVVLCRNRINLIKQDSSLLEMAEWMPGWYTRIMSKIDSYQTNQGRRPPRRVLGDVDEDERPVY